jgi:DnaJ-class molecular chaperone
MYKCWDCLGSGKKEYYHQIDNGVCYTCGGTGKTNMIQGEASKAHQENKANIAFHYQVENRIKKGKKWKMIYA